MNEQAFVEKREADWMRLTRLCDVADAGASRLSGPEVREFVKLYRRVSTDLAVARTQSTNVVLVDFLNDIVGRAYGVLYREPRPPLLASLLKGIELAAQTVRRRKWFVLLSMALLFGSAIFSFSVLSLFPETRQVLIPPAMESLFGGWKSGEFTERSPAESFMMTGFYAQHNPTVTILTGAAGAGTFGILSVYLIFQNGAVLGSLAHEVNSVGNLDFLLSSIAPHGVPELSGAIIGSAAGLLLGWALINPGRVTRGQALKQVGRDAIILLATSVVLMFIAAPIEGWFSFNPQVPGFVKVIVAVVSLAAWLAFWGFFGLTDEEKARRAREY